MNKSEREKAATSYLKANLEKLFSTYLNGHNPLDEKLAFLLLVRVVQAKQHLYKKF